MKRLTTETAARLLNALGSEFRFYTDRADRNRVFAYLGPDITTKPSPEQQREALNKLVKPMGLCVREHDPADQSETDRGFSAAPDIFRIAREAGRFSPALTIEVAAQLIRGVIGDGGEIFAYHGSGSCRVALRLDKSWHINKINSALKRLSKEANGGFLAIGTVVEAFEGKERETILVFDQPDMLDPREICVVY